MKKLNKSHLLERYRLAELQEQLNSFGYQTEVDVQVGDGDLVFDLVATSENRRRAYVVKVPSELRSAARRIDALRRAASEAGFEFRLHVATPPQNKDIEIEGFEENLLIHMIDNVPSELETMSWNTVIEQVSDVDIDSVSIRDGEINVSGTAAVSIELQSSGSGEDSYSSPESFYFDFDVVLDSSSLEIIEATIDVDTSPYYGS